MLHLLYYIVIFKVVACVCIYPDVLCMHLCIYDYMYVCMYVLCTCICLQVWVSVYLCTFTYECVMQLLKGIHFIFSVSYTSTFM